jgi:regulator of sigma E protease
MAFILNILIIILILGLIILVHELGHLIACKLTKVFVEEFAIGMGPKIFSRKIGETVYSLRLFPIGGFNKIRGEEYEDGAKDDDPRSLVNQKPSVKMFIYLSGVLMNLLLAIIIFYGLLISMSFKFGVDSSFEDFKPVVGNIEKEVFDEKVEYVSLVEGGIAESAGIPEEGTIKTINGEEIVFSSDVINKISSSSGEEISMEVCVEDICDTYMMQVGDDGRIGIVVVQNYFVYLEYVGWQRPLVGFVHVLNWGKIFGSAIGEIFSQAAETGDYEQVAMSVSGPVGLYVIVDYLRELGWRPLIGITADISLSIGIINLLPIPALDGGRAMMLLIEIIIRRPLNKKVEAWAIQISFILLLLLMVAVVFKDVIYFERFKELFN